MAASTEGSPSANPPLVYPSDDDAELWIVERPADQREDAAVTTFTGPNARTMALTYAYEAFGAARFFPFRSTT